MDARSHRGCPDARVTNHPHMPAKKAPAKSAPAAKPPVKKKPAVKAKAPATKAPATPARKKAKPAKLTVIEKVVEAAKSLLPHSKPGRKKK